MAVLTVAGMDRLRLLAGNPEAAVAAHLRIFGAASLRPELIADKKAQLVVGNVPVEIAATYGTMVVRPGWRSVVWAVTSLENVRQVLDDRAIKYDDCPDEHLIRTHPDDLYGFRLEFTAGTKSDQLTDRLLGIKPKSTVKAASEHPAAAAARIADLTGFSTYSREHPHLNAIGHGIAFPDHAIEFVGSKTNSPKDLVGGFLAEHGEGIFCLTLEVDSLDRARKELVNRAIPFNQWGRSSLLLGSQSASGALFELTDSA